jgi:ATP-dependent Clp protease protease subunit
MGQIFLYGAIGYEVDAKTIVQEINNTPEGETIEVYINSPGGDVYDGLSIYNALQSRKSKS